MILMSSIIILLMILSWRLSIFVIFYSGEFWNVEALDKSIGYFGALGLPTILFYWEWKREKRQQEIDDNLIVKEFLQFIRDTFPIDSNNYNRINGLYENQFYDDPLNKDKGDKNYVYFDNVEKECENLLHNISKKSKYIPSIKKLQFYSQTICDMLKFYWEHTDMSLYVRCIRYQCASQSIPLWNKINTIDLCDILVIWSEFIPIVTLTKFEKLDEMTFDRDKDRTFINFMEYSIYYQNKSFDKIKYYKECYKNINCHDKEHIFIDGFDDLMEFIQTQYEDHNLEPIIDHVFDVPAHWEEELTNMFQSVVCSLGNKCKKDASLKITIEDVSNSLKEYVKSHHTIFKINPTIFEDEN